MAHKKAGGSTRNGRDSESKRLGVKAFGGQKYRRAASSFVSEAHASTQATMFVLVKITPCLQQRMAVQSSTKVVHRIASKSALCRVNDTR